MKKLERETGSPTKDSCDSAKRKEKERQGQRDGQKTRALTWKIEKAVWVREDRVKKGTREKRRAVEEFADPRVIVQTSEGLAGEGQESTAESELYLQQY